MSLHSERVKTPLPEQLKNSFSFGNTSQNEEDGIEEETMMDDHHFEMKQTEDGANLEEFHRSESIQEEPATHQNTTAANNSRRNRFNQDMSQAATEVDEEPSDRKQKKRVKKKKLKKRIEEENTEEPNQASSEIISATNDTNINSTIKNDLFADMKRNHYLTISPNDIITKDVEEGDDGKTEENVIETARNVKTQGPTSQRQKTIFIESK